MKRLFLAFWPDEGQRNALVEATRDVVKASGGRPVPALNLHMTLTFLGSVPERRIPDLGSVMHRAQAALPSSFERLLLTLDQVEYWRKSQALCALAEHGSAEVFALAHALTKEAARAGFDPDLKPFRPHVTVARKVVRSTDSFCLNSTVWSFTEFVLLESRTEARGPIYRVLESYPFAATFRNREQ